MEEIKPFLLTKHTCRTFFKQVRQSLSTAESQISMITKPTSFRTHPFTSVRDLPSKILPNFVRKFIENTIMQYFFCKAYACQVNLLFKQLDWETTVCFKVSGRPANLHCIYHMHINFNTFAMLYILPWTWTMALYVSHTIHT